MKNILKNIGIIAANLLISAIVGMLLLDTVYLLPNTKAEINASQAIFLFNEEGSHQVNDPVYQIQSITDDYSDSIILSNCFIRRTGEPFYAAALRDSYLSMVDENGVFYPLQAYINYFSVSEPIWTVLDYSRYWNGYQVLLIPLLQFFTYPQLRVMNRVLLVMLTAAACIFVLKKYSWKYAFAFVCTVISLYPFFLYKTFQTSRIYNITMLAVTAFCLLKKEKRKFLFLYTGIIIAYLDLFSYPCLAPGILAVLAAIDSREEKNNINIIKELFVYMVLFVVGYIGMWLLKWLFTAVILGPDIFVTVFEQVTLHTGGSVNFAMGLKNIPFLFSLAFTKYVVVLLALFLLSALVLGFKNGFDKRILKDLLIFGLLALMPAALCLLIKGHAYRHPFFDFRNFGISVFSVFSWIAGLAVGGYSQRDENKTVL